MHSSTAPEWLTLLAQSYRQAERKALHRNKRPWSWLHAQALTVTVGTLALHRLTLAIPPLEFITISLFTFRTRCRYFAEVLPQVARLEPLCGVPMNKIPMTDSRTLVRRGSLAPLQMSNACSHTSPPRLCATKMMGLLLDGGSLRVSATLYASDSP